MEEIQFSCWKSPPKTLPIDNVENKYSCKTPIIIICMGNTDQDNGLVQNNPRRVNWWTLAFGVLGGLMGAGLLLLVISKPRGEKVELLPPPPKDMLMIHVSGAVVDPDVYSLPAGSRVEDAIQAAGGTLPEADEHSLNLAARLEDGDKIRVPVKVTAMHSPQSTGDVPENPTQEPSFPLDINIASQSELENLPGIGPVKAQAIIDYREESGPFEAIEDILEVSGIGEYTYELIRELITVGE
jgi:competence protein ComEA